MSTKMGKMLSALLTAAMLFVLVGCSKTCKANGCDNEAYKDGYCEYHYALNSLQDAAEGLIGNLFG